MLPGKYLGNLKGLLVTHQHSDRGCPEPILAQARIYPDGDGTVDRLRPGRCPFGSSPDLADSAHFTWQVVTAGDRWTVGDYTITAIPATHGGGYLEPLLYVIEREGRKLFYSTDTAPYREPAWDLLRGLGPMGT